jgi:3-phosphoshikimate 1-carboxyvinyltransferase
MTTPFGHATARASPALQGAVAAPGDKSLSHRALILAGIAAGESAIRGLLAAEDVFRTAAALRALGVGVERKGAGGAWRVRGGAWRAPERALYFGNSGTGCRLMMGAVAGRGVGATFDGDQSLRRRPMARVLEPLQRMGAGARATDGKLPVAFKGAPALSAINHALPVPSAQIKSAILLAALGARGDTIVREPVASRDHTERMLPAFGAAIEIERDGAGGNVIRLSGPQRLAPAEIEIPGDPSSAAFLVAAALIVPGSDILVRNVLVNPLRIGFYAAAREMGAAVSFENERTAAGEPVADIRARHSRLKGVVVPAGRAPAMIDEYPVLAVLAAYAEGETKMEGLGELRLKESDRIAAIEAGLAANGVRCAAGPDWLRVEGAGAPARGKRGARAGAGKQAGGVPGGGRVLTMQDHRIAMSFLVMGLGAGAPVSIDDASMIATSFPGFLEALRGVGANVGVQ